MANLAISLPQEVEGSFDQIRDFSAQIVRQATDTVTQATDRSWNAVAQTTERAKDSLIDTAGKAVNSVSQTASTAIGNPINSAISKQLNSIQIWLDAHPALSWIGKAFAWGVTHPIVSLIAIFLGIFVLRHFIKALGLFLEQTFLSIIQAPFKIGKFILGLCLIPLSKLPFRKVKNTSQLPEASLLTLNGAIPISIGKTQQERLSYILNRLEAIRQEQNQLLQEATSILSSTENVLK